jgi:hypothetical protein
MKEYNIGCTEACYHDGFNIAIMLFDTILLECVQKFHTCLQETLQIFATSSMLSLEKSICCLASEICSLTGAQCHTLIHDQIMLLSVHIISMLSDHGSSSSLFNNATLAYFHIDILLYNLLFAQKIQQGCQLSHNLTHCGSVT